MADGTATASTGIPPSLRLIAGLTLAFANFMVILDLTIANVSIPHIAGSLGITLDPLTQDSCAFYENNVLIADHGGAVVFEEQAGRDFAQAFGMNRAAIHQNHGHFTVGSTIDEAVFWFVCFERCAQAQLAAMAAGTPKHIPHESAVYTRENAGNAITGWMHFQPLWQEICRTDPDLFD